MLRQGDCQLKVCLDYIVSSRTVRERTHEDLPQHTHTQLDVMANSCRTWKVEAGKQDQEDVDSYIVSLRTAWVTQELALKQSKNKTEQTKCSPKSNKRKHILRYQNSGQTGKLRHRDD